ncbi:hypothetical protein NQ318_008291 [Aromia moschata]|uniref:Kinesin-like protein n=1 Tax=Aromia moschata TaxID=1265417 RepID=A0AAV8Y855_9CUCU|nr:hypothetical protein NQ318_008291 [Aromia moschata]
MIGYGDRARTQCEVVRLFRETHPDLPPLNQGTISKIEAQYREMGHVRKVPSKRQAVVDDDTKLNLLLALEENLITPARQLARDMVQHICDWALFVRIRPFIGSEINETKGLIQTDTKTITLSRQENVRNFRFFRVFEETCTQIDLYQCIAVPIVEKVFDGYNGTIFAYGQSGTGKTYTMVGDVRRNELKGIVPNIFSHIFTQISLSNKDISYVVTVTYLEIYNEEIRDLLSGDTNKKLTVREKPGLGVYVKDLLGFTVDSLEGVTEILLKGNKNRATGSTKLNDTSSRSHAIFSILIESRNRVNNKTTYGKLNLVDLAGSERVNKTLATGDRLREAQKINLSLSVLGNVISALVDGKASYIPYRNSKLTRLLQDSLGGNSLTAMIATISPSEVDFEESIYTLMYADRVRHIQNYVSVNVEKRSVIETFERKIEELKAQLEILTQQEGKEARRRPKRSKTSLDDEQLEQIEMEKSFLERKIKTIQRKILVGGENLLKKAQQQMELLESTAKELEHLDSSHQLLEEIIFFKGKEKSIVEKKYANLQEEDKELDRRIEETEKLIFKATDILFMKENEYQNEIETLLHTNKSLAKEMGLINFMINSYVPKEYMEKVKSNLVWVEDIQEWQVKGVAYCGNNLRRRRDRNKDCERADSETIFYNYAAKDL